MYQTDASELKDCESFEIISKLAVEYFTSG